MALPRRAAALAAALALLAGPLAAAEDADSFFDRAERFLRRIGTQYAIQTLRTVVDITYDSLAVDIRSNDVLLSGIRIRPALDWDRDGECVISIERVRAGDLNSFERLRSVMQVSGVTIPRPCFQPQQGAMLASFGFDGIEIDSMAIDASYDFPSSGAELNIQAAIRDAGDLTVSADFDYLYFRMAGPHAPMPDGELPVPPGSDVAPVARLDSLEIAFENAELFQRVEPLLAQQLGDVQALPQMAQAVMLEALSEGGARAPSAEEMEFVQNVSAEVERFVRDKDRLVISVAPEGGVLLTERVFETPVAALAALRPQVSATPLARQRLIAPARLEAALAGDAQLTDAERLEIGRALLIGEGAPRAVRAGARLLEPLAEAGEPQANLALARALAEQGRSEPAYTHALRAMAAGAEQAIGVADRLETELPLATVIAAQQQVMQAAPADDAALLAEGAVGALRARASDLASGAGAPRSYADAYYWASLAAAAGDRVSAALMRRLDASFSRLPPADREAWEQAAAEASERALTAWTSGGLGARLAAGAAR